MLVDWWNKANLHDFYRQMNFETVRVKTSLDRNWSREYSNNGQEQKSKNKVKQQKKNGFVEVRMILGIKNYFSI